MSLKVEIDWSHIGFTASSTAPDFVGTDVDVTSLVHVESGAVTLQYGRDQVTALAPTVSGRGTIILDNRDRKFSPRNLSSPLYGFIKPARPVRITRTVAGGGAYGATYGATYGSGDFTYTLFRGTTDDSPINPDVESKKVALSLVDGIAYFRGVKISTELYSGIRTGQAINYILDAAGWPTNLRDIDTGATVIPWWWEDNEDALTALEKLLRSEGPPALLTMGTSGEIIFMDRHHRLLNAESLTSQSTWNTSTGAEPQMNTPFSYDESWRNIINEGAADVSVRTPGQMQDVFSTESTFTIRAGETLEIIAAATDPFYDAETPRAGTDWTAVAGTVTAQLTRTSGQSTMIRLTASTGGNAIITGLRLRARPVSVAYTVEVAVRAEQSINEFGVRSMPGDLPWCNQWDAKAVLDTAVTLRSQPLPVVSATFLIANAARANMLLPLNLSDRITIVEPETALNHPFFIENSGHSLTADFDHEVTFGAEAAPVQRTPAVRLNVSGPLGFGYLTNPAQDAQHLMILGSNVSGHRLGEGILAW